MTGLMRFNSAPGVGRAERVIALKVTPGMTRDKPQARPAGSEFAERRAWRRVSIRASGAGGATLRALVARIRT